MLKKITENLFEFGYFVVLSLAGLALTFLAIQSLVGGTYIPLEIAERVEFHNNAWYFYPLLLLFILFLLFSRRWLEKVSEKQLFLAGTILYLLAALYLFFHIPGAIRADAKHVFNAALAFNQGDYSLLTTPGAYLYRNPHQLGLVSLERLYVSLIPTTQFVFVLNLLFTLGNNFLLYKITDSLLGRSLVSKYTILLSFLFFPHFFFIIFAYGSTPGIFFALFALYQLIKLEQTGSWKSLFLAGVGISLACLIRNNYFIFGLTLLACLLLSLFHDWKWKKLLAMVVILLGMTLPNKALTSYYEGVIGQPIGEGTPKIAYITMGLRDDPNRQTLGGWYDAYNTKILKRNKYDEKKASQMASRDLKKLIANFVQKPAYAAKFFYEKIKSTWTEPTFQSIWTGPQLERNQKTKTALLQSIYEEKTGYQLLNLMGMIFLATIYLLVAAFILHRLFWSREGLRPFSLYPYIFFLGGFFFHIFWETKSQYVYVYLLLLLPVAARALNWLGNWPSNKKESK